MRERRYETRNRFLQLARSRRRLAICGHAGSHVGAPSPIARKPAIFLKLGVGPRHRIRCNAEITRELSHRRQAVTGTQLTALDQAAELIHDLLKRRQIGIDRDKMLVHDAERDRPLKCREYNITQAHSPAHVTSETRYKIRCSGRIVGKPTFTKAVNTMMLPIASTTDIPAFRDREARSRKRSDWISSPFSWTGALAMRQAMPAMTSAQMPTINAAARCSPRITYGARINTDATAIATQTVGTVSAAGRGVSEAILRLRACSFST